MKSYIAKMDYSGLIVLFLTLCVSSAYTPKEPKTPIGSCNSGVISYCYDCFTVMICPTPTTTASAISTSTTTMSSSSSTSSTAMPTSTTTFPSPPTNSHLANIANQTCSAGNLCKQVQTYAVCDRASDVPNCECPPGETKAIPDAYNNQEYILCVEGDGTSETCPDGKYFNPDTSRCQAEIVTIATPPPISTTTPYSIVCGDKIEVKKVNCTWYEICIPGSDPVVSQCGPGEISTNDQSDPCKFYKPFSCADYAGTVWVSDTTNCSVAHFCVDGEEQGEPITCDDGQSFDNVTKICVDDPDGDHCSALQDCGICQDSATRIPIDCFSYYQCTAGTDEDDLPFVPVEKDCPSGTYYDPVSGSCTQTPPEGCEDIRKRIIYNY